MPIADSGRHHHYGDSPSPKRFGTVSPLDPAIFQGIEEFAATVVGGEPDPRYSPLRVAAWLDELSRRALEASERLPGSLSEASRRERIEGERASDADRVHLDVTAQARLGEFFAHKLRAGVAYELWKAGAERRWLATAVQQYRSARGTWARLARATSEAYMLDITFGGEPWLRGSWADRLAGIDQNISDVEAELESAGGTPDESFGDFAFEALDPAPPSVDCQHEAGHFRRGEAVTIALRVPESGGWGGDLSAWLHFRHVNQAEDYVRVEMPRVASGFEAEYPGELRRLSLFADVPLRASARRPRLAVAGPGRELRPPAVLRGAHAHLA